MKVKSEPKHKNSRTNNAQIADWNDIRSLKNKASKKHTKEFNKARARYPSPDGY